MIKPNTEMAFGQPVWDIYACEVCGALVLPSTAKLHELFHNSTMPNNKPTKSELKCNICEMVLTVDLDIDGAMVLDDYDEHMQTHGVE